MFKDPEGMDRQIQMASPVPGRRISDNLLLLREVVETAMVRGGPLGLLRLDLEKAFDRVSHDFLFSVVERMGVGGQLVAWVRQLYHELAARLLINGVLSETLPVGSGVRQGCPISPVLFMMCTEPFAQALRNSQRVRGVHIPGSREQGKVAVYMDDFVVICRDVSSVWEVMELANRFYLASGSKVNITKSEMMTLGDPRLFEGRPPWIQVQAEGIRILGVTFYREDSAKRNWKERMKAVKGRLTRWTTRCLTMEGRILVLKV